jgi:hypothetical protein
VDVGGEIVLILDRPEELEERSEASGYDIPASEPQKEKARDGLSRLRRGRDELLARVSGHRFQAVTVLVRHGRQHELLVHRRAPAVVAAHAHLPVVEIERDVV